MRNYGFLILVSLGVICFQSVEAQPGQPGPCRKLAQTFPASKIKGKMLHRSMYLDAFNDKMTKQNPVSLCFASVFPLARMKDYTVIGTDNKDFVIYYKCNYFSVSKNHVEIVNVYTREKTPSAGVLTGITEAFKKNGLDEAKVMILC